MRDGGWGKWGTECCIQGSWAASRGGICAYAHCRVEQAPISTHALGLISRQAVEQRLLLRRQAAAAGCLLPLLPIHEEELQAGTPQSNARHRCRQLLHRGGGRRHVGRSAPTGLYSTPLGGLCSASAPWLLLMSQRCAKVPVPRVRVPHRHNAAHQPANGGHCRHPADERDLQGAGAQGAYAIGSVPAQVGARAGCQRKKPVGQLSHGWPRPGTWLWAQPPAPPERRLPAHLGGAVLSIAPQMGRSHGHKVAGGQPGKRVAAWVKQPARGVAAAAVHQGQQDCHSRGQAACVTGCTLARGGHGRGKSRQGSQIQTGQTEQASKQMRNAFHTGGI